MKLFRRMAPALLALAVLLTLPAAALSERNVWGARAIVMDYDTGEVYFEKKGDSPQPAASMTKVMTAYLLCEDIHAGKLEWDTPIPVSQRAAQLSWDYSYSGQERLRAGRSYPARTLASLCLIRSACGASTAIAEYLEGTEEAFVARMNAKAAEWELDAVFADCTGWEDEGNAVTARAMAVIGQKLIALEPGILDITSTPVYYFGGRYFNNTCPMIRNRTLAGMDGLKTGYTFGAGRCFLGTACRSGRRILTVTMGCGEFEQSMWDSQRLIEYGFACIRDQVVPKEEEETRVTLRAAGRDGKGNLTLEGTMETAAPVAVPYALLLDGVPVRLKPGTLKGAMARSVTLPAGTLAPGLHRLELVLNPEEDPYLPHASATFVFHTDGLISAA